MKLYFVVAILLLAETSHATTLTVCKNGCNYSSVQAAIDAASIGDVIEVYSGFYDEQIAINKDVTLRGVNTGSGRTTIGIICLCNHSSSIISGISSGIMYGGYPGPNIHDNFVNFGTDLALDNVTSIGPNWDDPAKFNENFNGFPSYTLETQIKSNPVNTGDPFEVALYISGAGNVNSSKMKISIPPYIVQDQDVSLEYYEYGTEGRIVRTDRIIPRRINRLFNKTFIVIGLSNIYFMSHNNSPINVGELSDIGNESYPPFDIKFTIAENIPGGDYNMYVNLFYKYRDQWYMEKQSIPIHINYWYEHWLVQWGVIFALIFGILASIKTIIPDSIWNKLKRQPR